MHNYHKILTVYQPMFPKWNIRFVILCVHLICVTVSIYLTCLTFQMYLLEDIVQNIVRNCNIILCCFCFMLFWKPIFHMRNICWRHQLIYYFGIWIIFMQFVSSYWKIPVKRCHTVEDALTLIFYDSDVEGESEIDILPLKW